MSEQFGGRLVSEAPTMEQNSAPAFVTRRTTGQPPVSIDTNRSVPSNTVSESSSQVQLDNGVNTAQPLTMRRGTTRQRSRTIGTNNPLFHSAGSNTYSPQSDVAPSYHPYHFGGRSTSTRPSVTFSKSYAHDRDDQSAYYQPPYKPLNINEMFEPPMGNASCRSQNQSSSKGYTAKPSKFNGENWEAYKLQFTSCARANGWCDEECGRYLAACLVGNAAYTLALKEDGNWSFRELWSALDERYGQPSSEFLVRNKLRQVRQQPNQPLQALADDILQLVKGCSSSQVERDRLSVDAFIEALADIDVKRYLLENEPTNIQDALRKARKFNDIKFASVGNQRTPRVFYNSGSNAPIGPDPFKEIEALKARQAQLEHELMLARQAASSQGRQQSGPPNKQPSGYNNTGKGSNSANWRSKDGSS